MRTILALFSVTLFLSIAVPAQVTGPGRSGNPQVRQPGDNSRTFENQRGVDRDAARRAEMDRLAKRGKDNGDDDGAIPDSVKAKIVEEYRFPTEAEINSIRPLAADMATYKDFLKSVRTGIVRLADVDACKKIEGCTVNSMPGNGTSFSFRLANYRTPSMADLLFKDGKFCVSGVLDNGYLISLGDVSLDSITNKYEGLSPLRKFKVAKSIKEFKEIDKELSDKPETQRSSALLDNTYALRSVAYRGTALRTISNFKYNALAFDERSDVTVVFRVIRKHEDGSMTIIWKLMNSQDSPELK